MRNYKHIFILSSCNLKCSYCGGLSFPIDIDETIDCLEKIFNKFNSSDNCFRVECRGEITLYPKIIDYLEKKADDNYKIEIVSNGLLAHEVLSSSSKLRYIFSLDGHSEKMNINRGLNTSQINSIIDAIFHFNAEVHCVYYQQTIEEMNEFINFLKERNFNTKLHIFPCIIKNSHGSGYLDYTKLVKASFLPPKFYFDRWNYIVLNKKRNFECDFIKNGYSYFITDGKIYMVKCYDSRSATRFIKEFSEEIEIKNYPCNQLCINHNEYNNSRQIINL